MNALIHADTHFPKTAKTRTRSSVRGAPVLAFVVPLIFFRQEISAEFLDIDREKGRSWSPAIMRCDDEGDGFGVKAGASTVNPSLTGSFKIC